MPHRTKTKHYHRAMGAIIAMMLIAQALAYLVNPIFTMFVVAFFFLWLMMEYAFHIERTT